MLLFLLCFIYLFIYFLKKIRTLRHNFYTHQHFNLISIKCYKTKSFILSLNASKSVVFFFFGSYSKLGTLRAHAGKKTSRNASYNHSVSATNFVQHCWQCNKKRQNHNNLHAKPGLTCCHKRSLCPFATTSDVFRYPASSDIHLYLFIFLPDTFLSNQQGGM